jgi:hypothetical protein
MDSTDYSLWKTTKRIKAVTQTSTPLRMPQGTWARTNADEAQAFTNHLASVFQPHPPKPDSLPECYITLRLLFHSMESRPDHIHPEAWQNHLTNYPLTDPLASCPLNPKSLKNSFSNATLR